jgi:predicted transcriptional regulator
MKTTIHFDGMKGWAKRAKARAKAMDEGKKIERSKSITFKDVGEMSRLLTEARVTLLRLVKGNQYPIQELATALKRDVRAVSRDVGVLEEYGILRSEKITNPGHGVVRMVSAPANLMFMAKI